VAITASLLLPACREKAEGEPPEDPAASAPDTAELPPLVLRDDTADTLLTWLDDKGDFHVVQKIADVPAESREKVRAVITTRSEGTGELVYVADLRKQKPDGTYPVRSMTRAQWDDLGASKRTARLEALAPSVKKPTTPPPSEVIGVPGELNAVVYGADWCKPCHQAEALLKQLGVHVKMKDIEKDPTAQREMQAKLQRAGRSGGSIPVIDVMGKVFVGFDPRAIKTAVEAAREATTL
jgi:glutaredoxin